MSAKVKGQVAEAVVRAAVISVFQLSWRRNLVLTQMDRVGIEQDENFGCSFDTNTGEYCWFHSGSGSVPLPRHPPSTAQSS